MFLVVSIANHLDQTFTYSHKDAVAIGSRVVVPFGKGNRKAVGVVIECSEITEYDPKRIKAIVEVVDKKPIYSKELMQLAEWLSSYYFHPIGEVLRTMLPVSSKGKKLVKKYKLTDKGLETRASDTFAGKFLKYAFTRKVSLEKTVIKKMNEYSISNGIMLSELKMYLEKDYATLVKDDKVKTRSMREIKASEEQQLTGQEQRKLTRAQAKVFEEISLGIKDSDSKPFLLWGVTGAGKTEIYMQAIQALFDRSPSAQSLVLVPEISLTPQMTHVFESRFPGIVSVVHSALSDNERWEKLEKVRTGEARILIGPRSAVFAPFQDLKLIFVDEEHDSSYKQTTGLTYNGRDVAIVRAKLESATIVLGSATPSMETFNNAISGRYHYLVLNERVGGKSLPSVEIVRHQVASRYGQKVGSTDAIDIPISRKVIHSLSQNKIDGFQSIVLVNRRGFAYYLFLLEAGETVNCPQCSISLTVHSKSKVLRCHYCDYKTSIDSIKARYPKETIMMMGYGSEQAELYLKQELPDAKIVRIDSDIVLEKGKLAEILGEFREGKIDILVGTQILAKGHDFPSVTLICLIELDQMLNLPDFRSGERTFQLLVQSAGRAGRGDYPGKVLVQTSRPEHPVVQAGLQQDYLSFAEMEIDFRRDAFYPPFSRLVMFEFSSPKQVVLNSYLQMVEKWLEDMSEKYRDIFEDVMILGPAIPPIEQIRGRYRRTILVSSSNYKHLRFIVASIKNAFKRDVKDIRFKIDVDPQSII